MDQRDPQPLRPSRASTAPARRTRRAPSPFTYDADHPTVLVGNNNGPTPVEFLLHAIAACLTSGLANIASARGVTLHRVPSTVEGDIDLLGILGLSDTVRNGYRQIRVPFEIEGDASAEVLAALVDQSRRRSAVYDVLVNGTDVVIDVSPTEPRRRPADPATRPRPAPATDRRSVVTAAVIRRVGAAASWDVVVVGARVAGASTAMLLARAGLRVLCVDRPAAARTRCPPTR